MSITVGDIIRVQAVASVFGQQTITSWWYRVIGIGVNVNEKDTLLAINDYFNGNALLAPYLAYVACLPSSWDAGVLKSQKMHPALSVYQESASVPVNGGRGAATTSNLATVVQKGTDVGGRSQIGSWHLPGVASADMDADFTVPALDVLLATFASRCLNTLTIPVNGTQMEPVLYHPEVKDAEGVVIRPWSATKLTRALPKDTIRTMSRRTYGRGS